MKPLRGTNRESTDQAGYRNIIIGDGFRGWPGVRCDHAHRPGHPTPCRTTADGGRMIIPVGGRGVLQNWSCSSKKREKSSVKRAREVRR
jgi:protein-L-isoaspartate O-methyltransferase